MFFLNYFMVENSAFLTSVNHQLYNHMKKAHKKGSGKVTPTFAYFVESLMNTKVHVSKIVMHNLLQKLI